jgi:hypothetical protein
MPNPTCDILSNSFIRSSLNLTKDMGRINLTSSITNHTITNFSMSLNPYKPLLVNSPSIPTLNPTLASDNTLQRPNILALIISGRSTQVLSWLSTEGCPRSTHLSHLQHPPSTHLRSLPPTSHLRRTPSIMHNESLTNQAMHFPSSNQALRPILAKCTLLQLFSSHHITKAWR